MDDWVYRGLHRIYNEQEEWKQQCQIKLSELRQAVEEAEVMAFGKAAQRYVGKTGKRTYRLDTPAMALDEDVLQRCRGG